MFVLVSYDIADDCRRRKVFKMMKNYGVRVQYSVFECLLSATQIKEMKGRLKPLLDTKQDGVRYYLLCEACKERATVEGIGEILDLRPAVFA